jgi:hypothetical protein
VTENCDLAPAMRSEDLVQFLPGTIQHLPVTLTAGQYVFEVTVKKSSVLFGVLLGGVFESQPFHYANAALAKRIRSVDWQARHF